MELTYQAVAARIDHSVLSPTATEAEMAAGCHLALDYGTASICLKPDGVALARSLVAGSSVAACTVIGFPHGACRTPIKVREAGLAIEDGATEIDMVVDFGMALSGRWEVVEAEVAQVAALARPAGALLKVIFETCYLDRDRIVRLCQICSGVGVDYVKTSTGFGAAGANPAVVRLMREQCPPTVRVKASGGIRTLDDAVGYIDLGADRLGTSQTAAILDELRRRLDR